MTPQSLKAQTLLLLSRHRIELDPSLDEQQLIDQDTIKRFVEYSHVQRDETILEIGPGLGNITEALLEQAGYLIVIEKNPKYLPILRERFSGNPRLKVMRDDALKTHIPGHDRLASNLPYMIAEAFFQRTPRLSFKSATFIVPSRFAETIKADPASAEYTKLSRQAQLFYDITLNEKVPPSAYLPEPKASTAIVTLVPKIANDEIDALLMELLRQGDKYAKNALRESLIRSEICSSKREARGYIDELNLEPRILESRVSRLSLDDLQAIEDLLRYRYQ